MFRGLTQKARTEAGGGHGVRASHAGCVNGCGHIVYTWYLTARRLRDTPLPLRTWAHARTRAEYQSGPAEGSSSRILANKVSGLRDRT